MTAPFSTIKIWIAGAALVLAYQSQAVSATAVYAVTNGGALYKSIDGAATWQPVPIATLPAATYTPGLAIDPIGNIYLTLAQQPVGKGSPSGPPLR